MWSHANDLRLNHSIVHISTYGFYYLLVYRIGDVMNFDEWYRDINMIDCTIRGAYEAGAQSRQDEIDELKKMIEYMKRTSQRIMIAIDDGEVDHARRSARKILKGDQS